MNDAFPVGYGKGEGDLFGQPERLAHLEAPAVEPLAQRLALDVFENQEIGVVAFQQVEDLADSRAVETRENPRFA